MFLLYAVVIGIVAGFVLGGRLEGLERLRFRWIPLALGGLVVQVVLFLEPVEDVLDRADGIGAALYVASTAAVLVFVLANLRVPGLAVVAVGAAANFAAIVANGGAMPTTVSALAAAGLERTGGYSNSAVLDSPALAPLTDVFALPGWLPLANVFSLGDVLIAIGVAATIAIAMRRVPAVALRAGGDPPAARS